MNKTPTIILARLAAFISHELHFSVAIGDTGATKRFTPRIWQVLVMGVVLFGGSMFGAASFFTPLNAGNGSLGIAQQEMAEMQAMMAAANQDIAFKEQKIKVFAVELGTLQTRLEQFEKIGEKLFQDEYFGQYLEELENIDPVDQVASQLRDNPVSLFAMATQLASVKRRADSVGKVMNTSQDLLTRTQLHRNLKPHHWPVVHKRSYVSSRYGWRNDPFSEEKHWHSGMDIAAAYNAPVVSSADGVVTFAGYRFGYGIMVEVTHGGGMVTRYAHLNRAIVHNNQSVRAGELVGLMGSTGRATGPHLHFELLVGDHKIDPYPFVKDGRQNAKMLALSEAKIYEPSSF